MHSLHFLHIYHKLVRYSLANVSGTVPTFWNGACQPLFSSSFLIRKLRAQCFRWMLLAWPAWNISNKFFGHFLYVLSTAYVTLADVFTWNPAVDKCHINYDVKHMHGPTPAFCFDGVESCHLIVYVNSLFCGIITQYRI